MNCLESWVAQKKTTNCELCKVEYRQSVLSVIQAAISKAEALEIEAQVREIEYQNSCYGRCCYLMSPCPQAAGSRAGMTRAQCCRFLLIALGLGAAAGAMVSMAVGLKAI